MVQGAYRTAFGARADRGTPAARRLHRHPASVSGERLFVVELPAPLGVGRLPGRRYGIRQDAPDPRSYPARTANGGRGAGPADLPDLGDIQLAARGGALHPRSSRDGPSWD